MRDSVQTAAVDPTNTTPNRRTRTHPHHRDSFFSFRLNAKVHIPLVQLDGILDNGARRRDLNGNLQLASRRDGHLATHIDRLFAFVGIQRGTIDVLEEGRCRLPDGSRGEGGVGRCFRLIDRLGFQICEFLLFFGHEVGEDVHERVQGRESERERDPQIVQLRRSNAMTEARI